MHLGHRRSIDLDFFTPDHFDTQLLVADLSSQVAPVSVLSEAESSIVGNVDGIKFSLFRYPYPLVERTIAFEKIDVAAVLDIASMKIVAICQRGTKRDFVDLHAVLQSTPFRVVAESAVERFGPERLNPVHVGKALMYFADAESDPDPVFTKRGQVQWKAIKRFFTDHVRQFVLDLEAASTHSSTG